MKGATSIQERLWELRKDKGLNLEELSKLTGLSKSRRKGEAVTVTPASSVRFSSISIEIFRSLVDTIYSGVVTLL